MSTASLPAWTAMPARLAVLHVVVLCLSVPLVIGSVAGVDLPLSVVAIALAVPFYLSSPAIVEKKLLTTSMLLAVLAAGWTVGRGASRDPIRAGFSVTYFFAPYLTFFAGYALVRRHQDLSRIVAVVSQAFAVVAILITASLVVGGQAVRVMRIGRIGDYVGPGSALAGSLLGLPLYATWGVISLAVFYATMLAVVAIRLRYQPPRDPIAALVLAGGGACLLYLVVGSLSRTVALGMVAFGLAFGWSLIRQRRVQRVLLGAAVPVLLALAAGAILYGEDLLDSNWSVLARANVESLQAAKLDTFTSGRLTLVWAALEDLAAHPLTGSGFGGFRAGVDRYNSSPHNQYLTAIWKMGIPAAAFYFAFLWRCVSNLRRLRRSNGRPSIYDGFWALTLAYGLGFCLTWDVLLVPLTGAFVMFLFGAFGRLAKEDGDGAFLAGRGVA